MIAPNENPSTGPVIWPDDLKDSLVTGLADGLWFGIKEFHNHHKLDYTDEILVKAIATITQDRELKTIIWSEFDKNQVGFLALREVKDWKNAQRYACYLAVNTVLEYLEPRKWEIAKLLLELKQQTDADKPNKKD